MFIGLYDESKDVWERINAFKLQASILLEKFGNGASQHYQYENAITTYLWLRYPDKYYIYKFSEVKSAASELEKEWIAFISWHTTRCKALGPEREGGSRLQQDSMTKQIALLFEEWCHGEGCILIDDYQKNINEWEAYGGTGILFRDADSAMKQLQDLGIL